MFPFMLEEGFELLSFVYYSLLFLGSLLIVIILGYWHNIAHWWDYWFGYDYTVPPQTNNKTYSIKPVTYNVPKTKYNGGLYPNERKEPPKALFFERAEGNERSVEGPWEEVYLNAVEKNVWNSKKWKEPTLTTENNTKKPEMDESRAFLEQNDEFKGYRG